MLHKRGCPYSSFGGPIKAERRNAKTVDELGKENVDKNNLRNFYLLK